MLSKYQKIFAACIGAGGLVVAVALNLSPVNGPPITTTQETKTSDQLHTQDPSPFGQGQPRSGNSLDKAIERSLPSTTPISQSKRIEKLSASSNPNDNFKAYSILNSCKTFRDAQRDGIVSDQELVKAKCADFTDEQIRDRLKNLDKALKAKVPGSVVEFVNLGPFGDATALETRPTDPLVIEWKERALAMLNESAKNGDAASVGALALMYQNGGALLNRDSKLALVYEVAHQEIQGTLTKFSSGRQARNESIIKILSNGLTEQEVASAVIDGKRFAQTCCIKKNNPSN